MALDSCGQVCKVVLILFNVVFVVVGMAMFCGGLYLRFSADGPMDLKTDRFIVVVSVLIAVGAVVLITSIFGDIGSCNENKSTLGVYTSLMVMLTILTAIAGILAFTNIDEFRGYVGEFYAVVYTQYQLNKDGIRSVILKLFHKAFDCCGLGGTVQTIFQQTDFCPEKTSVLGLTIATSSNCVTAILADLQASTVLQGFLGAAGFMFVAVLFASVLCHQFSRPTSSPPPYVLLTSSIPLSATTPVSSVTLSSPPPEDV